MQEVWLHLKAKLAYDTGSEVCGNLGRWWDRSRSKGSFWDCSTAGLRAGHTGVFTLWRSAERSTCDSFTLVYHTKVQLKPTQSQVWQHRPAIPVIREAHIGGLQVQGQPGQVGELPSQNLKGGQGCCSAVEHLTTFMRQWSTLDQPFLLEKIQTAQYWQKNRHKPMANRKQRARK